MDGGDLLELAKHIDRVRAPMVLSRDAVVRRVLTRGWVSVQPGAAPADVPSNSADRMCWLAPDRPIRDADLEEAAAVARGLWGVRMYLWIAPWAHDQATQQALAARGLTRWPYVEYIAFARPASAMQPPRPSACPVRELFPPEAPAYLEVMRPWYSDQGIRSAARQLEQGLARAFIAQDPASPEHPVALALLTMDGAWAYLSAAGTDPAFRGRGAQSALIAARVREAARAGCRWCACETNTTVPISMKNLLAASFQPRIAWCVYRWDLAPAPNS